MPDQSPAAWRPERAPPRPGALPPMLTALGRGLLGRCPVCGQTRLFRGYLTVATVCPHCGTPLGRVRADDAPPYFTILVVGHIVVPLMLLVELRADPPPLWVTSAIFLPLALTLTLLLLRPIKGATVGLMLKLDMLNDADD